MTLLYRPFINGQFVSSTLKRNLIEPFSGNVWATVEETSKELVNEAISSANDAFYGDWSLKWTGAQRRDLMHEIARTIELHEKTLCDLESKSGKPGRQARADIQASAECFRFFAGLADKLSGRVLCVDPKYRTMTMREPFGVCGMIISFNYPLLLASWKLAPALAVGNTIVLKPSPQTPCSILHLMKCISHMMPRGVVNVIPGGADVGQWILEDPKISKISFTGSTKTGRSIASQCGDLIRPVLLELGGKNPLIVCDDADLDLAADGIIDAAFCKTLHFINSFTILANSGQNCCAGSRLFVHETIYDSLIKKIQEKVPRIRVGDPFDEATDLGPLVDQYQYEKVKSIIHRAKQEGIPVLVQGDCPITNGYFVAPIVFHNVPDDSDIACNEIFGPVLSILKPNLESFKDLSSVWQRVNHSHYGLGAGIWTKKQQNIDSALKNIKAGMIWINCYNDNPSYLPFGGYKNSGYGKDLGEEAIAEFSFIKSMQSLI